MAASAAPRIALALLCSLLLASCSKKPAPPKPTLWFTKLPPFGEGDPSALDPIEGRVTGVGPGDRIVLYARSGDWWVQPFASEPFTSLQADLRWSGRTHPGAAYAALLVTSGFRPNARMPALPAEGGAVSVKAVAYGPSSVPFAAKTVIFGGYEWLVRETPSERGGTHNRFDRANAWVDGQHLLHLRISGYPGHWRSAEVNLIRSLGYGSYRFVVRDLARLEPSAVFTAVASDDDGPSREMAVEISKWGETSTRNGQFVIQPYRVPANTVQFQVPAGKATFMLRWSPGRAAFKALPGATSSWESPAIREHVFTSGVPAPGSEAVHMNLYVFGDNRNPLRRPAEVVVEAFEYLP